jgi:hypothetical protein
MIAFVVFTRVFSTGPYRIGALSLRIGLDLLMLDAVRYGFQIPSNLKQITPNRPPADLSNKKLACGHLPIKLGWGPTINVRSVSGILKRSDLYEV